MRIETKKQIANLISNILNPFLGGLVIIVLLSFASASSALDALKWTLISVALSVLPILLLVVYMVRSGRLDAVFTIVRRQRTRLYLISVFFASVNCVLLIYLGAPTMLIVGFIAGLSMTLIFMGINLWWKISLHTAFIAASATVSIMLYGWIAALTIALVPLTAWARIELKHHSLAQVTGGALLAVVIVVVALSPYLLV